MKAITVQPGHAGSASLEDVPEPGVCLTGVGTGGRTTGMVADAAASLVLRNNVIVGSVNANKRHWYKASESLLRANRAWLAQLVTRRERPEGFRQALARQPDDIKVVVQFADP